MFDQGNRMRSAAGKATYGYDGLGHRMTVVGTDGVNRVQVYSQEGQLLYVAPSGGTATKYIYLHKHVLAEVTGATTTYDHTDALGSPGGTGGTPAARSSTGRATNRTATSRTAAPARSASPATSTTTIPGLSTCSSATMIRSLLGC